jgi:hypothetical protein
VEMFCVSVHLSAVLRYSYCEKQCAVGMQSVTDSSYTGTVIVCTWH